MSTTFTDNEAKRYLADQLEETPPHYTEEAWADMLQRYKALRPPTRTGRRRVVRFETEYGRDGSYGVRQVVTYEGLAPVLTVNDVDHADDAFWSYPEEGEPEVVSTPERNLVDLATWQKATNRTGLGALYPHTAAEATKGDQGSGNDKTATAAKAKR